jgi:hypothetical protein
LLAATKSAQATSAENAGSFPSYDKLSVLFFFVVFQKLKVNNGFVTPED